LLNSSSFSLNARTLLEKLVFNKHSSKKLRWLKSPHWQRHWNLIWLPTKTPRVLENYNKAFLNLIKTEFKDIIVSATGYNEMILIGCPSFW